MKPEVKVEKSVGVFFRYRCLLHRYRLWICDGWLRAIKKYRSELAPGGLTYLLALSRRALGGVAFAIWGPVVAKSLGFFGLLGLVAYLGHVSRDFERYGAVRFVDQHVAAFLDRTEPRGGKHKSPNQPPPAPDAAEENAEPTRLTQAVETPAGPRQGGCPEEGKKGPSGITPEGQVILNIASKEELSTLPGIGPSRAEAILALRERLGRFKRVSDLLRIKGIGYKSLQKLKAKVILDPPPDPTDQKTPPPHEVQKPASSPSKSPPSRSGKPQGEDDVPKDRKGGEPATNATGGNYLAQVVGSQQQ